MSSIFDKLKDIEKESVREEELDDIEIVDEDKEPSVEIEFRESEPHKEVASEKKSYSRLIILLSVFVLAIITGIYAAKYFSGSLLTTAQEKDKDNTKPLTKKPVDPQPAESSSAQKKSQASVEKPSKDTSRNIYVYHGNIRFTEKLYRDLKNKPDDHEVLNNLAVALQEQGKYEEALKHVEKTLVFRPENPFYWNNLGTILTSLRLYVDGEKAFKKAISLSAGQGVFYYNLANLYERSGNMALARDNYLTYLAKADNINPDNMKKVREKLQKGMR